MRSAQMPLLFLVDGLRMNLVSFLPVLFLMGCGHKESPMGEPVVMRHPTAANLTSTAPNGSLS